MTPIYRVGTVGVRQAAQRVDGQWFYRTKNYRGHWGRWLPCPSRPDGAWYDPRAGKANLPKEVAA